MEMRPETFAIDKLYKRRDRFEIPDWQRNQVWPREKQRDLVDSILRGWKLPKFYLVKTGTSPDQFEVVDGQQRLSAIWDFFDDELSLNEEQAVRFGAARYSELPDSISDAFDDFKIECDVITDADDKDLREFFQRLQQGLSLNSSERLNSIPSKLRNYCRKIADDDFFSKSTTIVNRRYAYFDICAKVMCIELEGLETGLRFDDIKAAFESHDNYSGASTSAKRMRTTLRLLRESLPEASIALRNRSMVQSVITLTSHLIQAGAEKPLRRHIHAFLETFSKELARQIELGHKATDQDYISFQRTVNANTKGGARIRHDILLKKLLALHPELYSDLSSSSGILDGVAANISKRGRELQIFVTQVNEQYAATNGGRDLFKATNKTAGALTRLTEPVTSVKEYETLINDLYFVFWESPGQRFDENFERPNSFRDVNELRTSMNHDVDHGKAGAVARKRKRLSETFRKYSGGATPDSVHVAQLKIAQLNILDALVQDLRTLMQKMT
jgi:hypothetical protein